MTPASAWLLPLFALALSQAPQNDAPAKPAKESAATKLSNAINDLRVQRNTAEAYVLRAKVAAPPVPADAQKLYDDARAKYNAYIETFLDGVRQNSKADLQEPLKQAVDAATKFKEYVDANTKAMSAGVIIPIGKAIFDALVTVRDESKKRGDSERKQLADEWAKTLPWKAWADIK